MSENELCECRRRAIEQIKLLMEDARCICADGLPSERPSAIVWRLLEDVRHLSDIFQVPLASCGASHTELRQLYAKVCVREARGILKQLRAGKPGLYVPWEIERLRGLLAQIMATPVSIGTNEVELAGFERAYRLSMVEDLVREAWEAKVPEQAGACIRQLLRVAKEGAIDLGALGYGPTVLQTVLDVTNLLRIGTGMGRAMRIADLQSSDMDDQPQVISGSSPMPTVSRVLCVSKSEFPPELSIQD